MGLTERECWRIAKSSSRPQKLLLFGRKEVPLEVIEWMVGDPDPVVNMKISSTPKISEKTIEALVSYAHSASVTNGVQSEILSNLVFQANTPPNYFENHVKLIKEFEKVAHVYTDSEVFKTTFINAWFRHGMGDFYEGYVQECWKSISTKNQVYLAEKYGNVLPTFALLNMYFGSLTTYNKVVAITGKNLTQKVKLVKAILEKAGYAKDKLKSLPLDWLVVLAETEGCYFVTRKS